MIRNIRGQAVAMDLILVCICVSIFAVGIWSLSTGGKAPESQAFRSRQDYVKSMLLTALFTTPEPTDLRYSSKSMSDLLCMHLTNPEGMPIDVVIAKMEEAKIGEALEEKAIGSEAEWIIYADTDAASSTQGKRAICLHGKSGSDLVEECPGDIKITARESTAATAEVVFPSGVGKSFIKMPIFLTVKWS
jgi:hypothetical protein